MNYNTHKIQKLNQMKRNVGLIFVGLTLMLGFQNCGFALKDVPQSASNTIVGTGGMNIGTSSKVANCLLSVDKAAIHLDESYSYQIQKPDGSESLPEQVKIRTFGTKSKLDGSETVTDADGAVSDAISLADLKYTNSGSEGGDYSRRFEILDAESGQVICETNKIHFLLTPACQLTVQSTNVKVGDYVNFNLSTSSILGTPAETKWYGTKDSGIDAGALTVPYESIYAASSNALASDVGNFTKFIDVKDENGSVLCRTNKVSLYVADANSSDSFGEGGSQNAGGSEGYGGSSEGGGDSYGGSVEGGNQGGGSEGGGSSYEGGGGDFGGGL